MGFLKTLAMDNGIQIKTIPDEYKALLASCGGGCAYSGGILLDAELCGAEKKLVAAHEIAHILFGHCNHPSPYQEEEARIFAAVVVAMELFRAYEQGQPLGPQGGYENLKKPEIQSRG